MKISDFKNRIVRYYDSGISIYLKGGIGLGKSTVIESAAGVLAKAKGGDYGTVIVSAPLLTPSDAVGYGTPQRVERVRQHLMMLFTEPFWFLTTESKHIEEYDGGIIFIDEMDKADTDVKKVLGEMALSNRLGPHVIPSTWRVWGAGNRASDGGGSTKEYNHLINRRMEIELDFDLQTFEDYCMENGVHPLFIAVAGQNPHMFGGDMPTVQGPFCTPRSFVRCAQYVQAQQTDPDQIVIDPLLNEEMQGMIGAGAAATVAAGVTLFNEMPKFKDIVASPSKVKVPSRADAQILVVYNLAARVDEHTMGPVISYVERMPPEFTIAFGKAACRRNPMLVNTAAFGKWCTDNATLMMAITSQE